MLSWRPRPADPVTAPETDAARPGVGPQPFVRPAVPPIDQASYDDLIRAHATLRRQEDVIALYEGRPSNLTCPRPCCTEVEWR